MSPVTALNFYGVSPNTVRERGLKTQEMEGERAGPGGVAEENLSLLDIWASSGTWQGQPSAGGLGKGSGCRQVMDHTWDGVDRAQYACATE